jgi:hypothetical protein
MKLVKVDSKLKAPHSMNGKVKNLRFEVTFNPSEIVEVPDSQFDVLSKDESFESMVEEGFFSVIEGKGKKSNLETLQEAVEKAEAALEASKTDEEKKAAKEALETAKANLKKASKKAKKK